MNHCIATQSIINDRQNDFCLLHKAERRRQSWKPQMDHIFLFDTNSTLPDHSIFTLFPIFCSNCNSNRREWELRYEFYLLLFCFVWCGSVDWRVWMAGWLAGENRETPPLFKRIPKFSGDPGRSSRLGRSMSIATCRSAPAPRSPLHQVPRYANLPANACLPPVRIDQHSPSSALQPCRYIKASAAAARNIYAPTYRIERDNFVQWRSREKRIPRTPPP